MHKIDRRSLLTYMVVVLVGLVLLMLVLPSVVPFALFGMFFAIIPPVALVALLYYQFGKSERSAKQLSYRISKTVASIATVALVFSVGITYVSTKQSAFGQGTLRYVFENIGVGLLFLAFACVLLLVNSQKFIYWPFWGADDRRNSDERQRSVRNRVFEKSYRLIILILIIDRGLNHTPSQRLHDELFQAMVLCIFGIPAIVAAWQKDS